MSARTRIGMGWVTAGLVAFAALIRIPTIGTQSYWGDEAVTVGLLHKSFGGLMSAIPDSESTPPLYYVLSWIWARIFGFGEAGLRSLSFVLGVLTVLVVLRAAQLVGSRRIVIAAGLLAAVNPLLVWYSQEARAYGLFILLGSWSFLWFLRAAEDIDRRRNLVMWSVASALALTAHYFAAFLVVAEAAWLIYTTRRARAVLTWSIPWALTGIALLPMAYEQRNHASWITGSGGLATRFKESIKNLLVGLDPPFTPWTFVLAALLALVALAFIARGQDRPLRIARLSFAAGVSAVVLTVIPELGGYHYVNGRNLSAVLIAFILPVAIGLGVSSGRRAVTLVQGLALAGLTALSLAIVLNVYLDPNYQKENWELASRMLGPATQPRAIVGQRRPTKQVLALYGQDVKDLPAAGVSVARLVIVDASGEGRVAPEVPGFRLESQRSNKSIVIYSYSAPHPVHLTTEQLVAVRPEPKFPRALAVLQLPS